MRRIGTLSALCLSAVAIFGCISTEDKLTEQQRIAKEEELVRQEELELLRKAFNRVHSLVASNKLKEANVEVAFLKTIDFDKAGAPYLKDELAVIEKYLKQADALQNHDAANVLSEKRMLNDAQQMSLPDTYGTTVVIDAKLPPVTMPEGPMEKILNSKVSIYLDNAGIAELVGALKETCKLNVIADDALAEEKKLTIAVDDVPLKEILTYISRNMGIAFHLGENILWITQATEINPGPMLETRIIRLRQGAIPTVPSGGPGANGAKTGGVGSVPSHEDNELDTALATFMADSPEGATYKIFRDRNILVIRDTKENLRMVEELVKEFDKPPYQVCIEARFITVSQDDLKDLGAEITQKTPILHHGENEMGVFDALSRGEALKAVNALTQLNIIKQGNENGVGLLNFSGVLANRTFDVLITALDKKKSTATLSVPKVTVLNNREARIRKGDKRYYFEEYDVVTVNKGDNKGDESVLAPTGSPTELPTGLTFDVKVNVGNDGNTILLGLKPEIVEFKGWESYQYAEDGDDDDDDDEATMGTIKLPRTYEQAVITSVSVASGQTVVLGGMLENQKGKTVTKIPILGDLPLIGYFFRHTERTSTPTNLLIFVTATVINEKGEYVETHLDESGK